ncbi:MAG TPA: serine/threonine-protein kinase [Pyrinomonadaceae bacterium]
MKRCPACSNAVAENILVCPSCGAALSGTQPTVRQPPPREHHAPRKSSHSISASSRGEGHFIAGTVLDERYRILGLLGRGGMGEVYKAEDLKLNQTVALKFLPENFARDEDALERFYGEVRTARQVSHPNVCRVFDVGEVEGAHFLSMEFIDGDDLSSLLRRIGRLPPDKAVEIARQLCAGLHAIHQVGVLHRDLKPANAIIDGRGKARITDFGIAGLESELKDGAGLAGTPAYMSPEQITGKELTAKSDIYSLGLVLYEIFTGRQAFEGDTLHELIRKHRTAAPSTPSEFVKDIDPLVEQVILRCLEKDPEKRPASALQVALSLPGGDPLQAALAMGETPSPEMVAAAGEKTGLRPSVALACMAAVLACLVGLAYVSRRVSLIERIPFENSPEILASKGREAMAQLGYPERPFDSAYGLDYGDDYLRYVEQGSAPDGRRQLDGGRGGAVYLWYRESPNHLEPLQRTSRYYAWTVDISDPPPTLPGMRGVKLDTLGRLREFYARPPQFDEAKSGAASAPDWGRLFTLAGLDPSRFTPAEAVWNPESAFDARAAWTGTAAESPDIPLRVEAAAYRGQVVFFKLVGPWTKPFQAGPGSSVLDFILRFVLLFLAPLILAWRNYRRGKGDLQGALRLAGFGFAGRMLFWLLTASHVSTGSEMGLFVDGLSTALSLAVGVLVLYLALEPYVRRRWPTSLITWSRVLAGKFTDPLVGRDFLVGILLGLCFTLIPKLYFLNASQPAADVGLDVLLGARFAVGDFLHSMGGATFDPLGFTFLLTLLRALVRRNWLVGAVVLLLAVLPGILGGSPAAVVVGLTFGGLLFLAFTRFGLLTLSTSTLIFFWLNSLPFTTNLSAWYAGTSLFVMLIVTALAGCAFYTSLGGQKVFKGNLLED